MPVHDVRCGLSRAIARAFDALTLLTLERRAQICKVAHVGGNASIYVSRGGLRTIIDRAIGA